MFIVNLSVVVGFVDVRASGSTVQMSDFEKSSSKFIHAVQSRHKPPCLWRLTMMCGEHGASLVHYWWARHSHRFCVAINQSSGNMSNVSAENEKTVEKSKLLTSVVRFKPRMSLLCRLISPILLPTPCIGPSSCAHVRFMAQSLHAPSPFDVIHGSVEFRICATFCQCFDTMW